ncbi:MAG: YbhB/YbcL family Raf kinase inhibitor-like protein [Candidatus Nanohaloarchaea archaeon]|nr:YbhB/YbcL family Raf kinase inhibitor-like protein [Candidatus Nanohaloarchaea archaeon]
MELTSPAFDDGERIPRKYGYTEQNINPPLAISGVPDDAAALVLLVDDPDAREPAGKIWDHWVLYNIPIGTTRIDEGSFPEGAEQGQNDYGELGYGGPNPPDSEHTYRFRLYAVDQELGLGPGATKDEVKKAMDGHVVAEAGLDGTYAP